jgi:hypothetical protein
MKIRYYKITLSRNISFPAKVRKTIPTKTYIPVTFMMAIWPFCHNWDFLFISMEINNHPQADGIRILINTRCCYLEERMNFLSQWRVLVYQPQYNFYCLLQPSSSLSIRKKLCLLIRAQKDSIENNTARFSFRILISWMKFLPVCLYVFVKLNKYQMLYVQFLSSWWWAGKPPEICRALTAIKNTVLRCILLVIHNTHLFFIICYLC